MNDRSRVNVRGRTNVLCTTLRDENSKVVWDLRLENQGHRLFFWELRALRQVYPLLIPAERLHSAYLTARQQAERDAFIREGPEASPWEGIRLLAGRLPPMSAVQGLIPFFQRERSTPILPAPAPSEAEPIAPRTGPDPTSTATRPDRQQQIVGAPLTARMVVLAPPGTGKTHTLIQRICHLINTGQVRSAAQEILVLSFTRSAVEEIRRRILVGVAQGMQDNLRYVNVQTFDSFASRMLLRDCQPEELPGGDYDDRIRHFTAAWGKGQLPEAGEELARVRFLLVDEIQDMVGPRAHLVLALVRQVTQRGGGVLLLGDPAQAIFDWEQRQADELRSAAFLAQARQLLGPQCAEIELDVYHRYDPGMRDFVLAARAAMGPDGQAPDGAQLEGLLQSLPAVRFPDLAQRAGEPGSAVVLTRTNLEAYQVGDWLERQNVPRTVWRGTSGDYWPGWVARLTLGFAQERMSFDMARARWQQLVAERERTTFEEALAFLRAQNVVEGTHLDLAALSRKVLERSPRQGETRPVRRGLTVSTIHRSKGLEFDRVFVLRPKEDYSGNAEEVRVLYVAATRARKELCLLDRAGNALRPGFRMFQGTRLAHFLVEEGRNRRLLIDGIEELNLASLLDARDSGTPDGRQVQEALWGTFAGHPGELTAVAQGSECELRLPLRDGTSAPTRLCRLARAVGDDLDRVAQCLRRRAEGLAPVPVVDLATVAFPLEEQVRTRFLGAARLALAPVLYGFATIQMGAAGGRQ